MLCVFLLSALWQALRKADMVRKNAVDGVLTERNILATVRSPFMVRPPHTRRLPSR